MKLVFKTSGAKQIDLVSNFYFGRVGADVSFPADRDLGSLHGQFIIEGKKAYIMDRGSTTGTFVNDVKIPPNKKVELKDGDWIRFGSQVASFLQESKDPAVPERKVKAPPPEVAPMSQTGMELLAKAKKLKEAKLQGFEEQCNQTKAALKVLTDELEGISSKIALTGEAIEEAEKRRQEIKLEVQRRTANKDALRKALEDKKSSLYNKQITLKDKLQLLELAQAPEAQRQPLQEELDKMVAELTSLENEKKLLPQKIIELNKECGIIEKKSLEDVAQREKLNGDFQELNNKYAPEIQRLQSELKSLESALAKAREGLNK